MDNSGSDDNTNSDNRKTWRLGIVLSGNIVDGTGFLKIVSGCDYLICADGGARHLRPYGILPDMLTGDMDSITEADKRWLEQAQIPVNQFPTEKDYTDSELAVDSVLKLLMSELQEKNLPRPANRDISIILLAASGSRPDHVLGNQMMAAKLAREQYDVMLSDGSSMIYLLEGPASRTFNSDSQPEETAVSVISLSEKVKGITYQGLRYPLVNYDLAYGSQRGISNRISDFADSFEISLTSGTLMIIITPAE